VLVGEVHLHLGPRREDAATEELLRGLAHLLQSSAIFLWRHRASHTLAGPLHPTQRRRKTIVADTAAPCPPSCVGGGFRRLLGFVVVKARCHYHRLSPWTITRKRGPFRDRYRLQPRR
jgi:hypothetical protein